MGRPRILTDEQRLENRRIYMRGYRIVNAERLRKIGRDWMRKSYHGDPDARAARLAASAKWQKEHAESGAVYRRRHKLLKKYGITVEQYEAMLTKQQGICAICDSPPLSNKRLAVDHDHKTGSVRELLCDRCNRLLGHFEGTANPTCLLRVIYYLERHDQTRRR